MLPVGSIAPDFSSVDQHGKPLTLGALLERGRLVLYFYPRDFTTVCTAQACAFRDSTDEFATLSAQVAGVSRDDQETHRRFAERYSVKYPLLADESGALTRAYAADRWLLNFAKRITYVIAPDRKILGAFRHELSAQKHIDDVRALLNAR